MSSVAEHRAYLVHVGVVLRLHAPDMETESITPKAIRKLNNWLKPSFAGAESADAWRA